MNTESLIHAKIMQKILDKGLRLSPFASSTRKIWLPLTTSKIPFSQTLILFQWTKVPRRNAADTGRSFALPFLPHFVGVHFVLQFRWWRPRRWYSVWGGIQKGYRFGTRPFGSCAGNYTGRWWRHHLLIITGFFAFWRLVVFQINHIYQV